RRPTSGGSTSPGWCSTPRAPATPGSGRRPGPPRRSSKRSWITRGSTRSGWRCRPASDMGRTRGPDRSLPALTRLTIVIPARDEEGCIASTVEHLHVELRIKGVPHEIVVVDDGSRDRTWEILELLKARVPALAPVRNPGPHG